MNIRKRIKPHIRISSMAARLWGIMMLLVLFTVAFMWVFQVYFMERNYIESNIGELQLELEPIMEDLEAGDLACDEQTIAALGATSFGKMFIIDKNGQLMAMYSYGHPINLAKERSEILVWEQIAEGEDYDKIQAGEAYIRKKSKGARILSYETGIPIRYNGQVAYLVMYRSFTELYSVLDMNRKLLMLLSVVLTLAAALLAALLAKRFTRPVLTIKKTVDRLAEGELTAVTGLKRRDEIGKLADSVEKLGQALQRVDVLRKEVIANVSHELRSPLALIGGYAEMVKDITWKDEAARNENLDLIISETRRMSEMVDDIMDYSQLQSGYLQLKPDHYDLYEIVEAEALHFERIVLENHLTLHMEPPRGKYPAFVDALKISQVIRNLLNNAVNHTQDGNTITISFTENRDGCKVSVCNPGEPIPEEDRELIWERYGRSQHQGSRRQGTGIGLSIVSAILNAHGMPYGVECSGGQICFWFLYPAKIAG